MAGRGLRRQRGQGVTWRRGSGSVHEPGWAWPASRRSLRRARRPRGLQDGRRCAAGGGNSPQGSRVGAALEAGFVVGVHPKAQDSPPSQALWTEPEPSGGRAGGREPLPTPRNWGRASLGPLALGSPLAVVSGPVPHTAGPTATPPLWPGSHHSSHKGSGRSKGAMGSITLSPGPRCSVHTPGPSPCLPGQPGKLTSGAGKARA